MFSRPDWRCLFCLLGLALACCAPANAARAVVNAVQPDDEIADRSDLRAVFTLRKRLWSSGAPVTVYVLPDAHPVHDEFVKTRLHLYPYQLRQIWNRLVFSGTGVAPVELQTEGEIIEAVRNNPNAIGYVDGAELPEGVKEVPVSPDQPAVAADGGSEAPTP